MKEAYQQMSRIEKETVETDMLKQKNYMRNELSSKYVLVMCDVDLCMLHHETMIGFKL
jgi:hypothetical protein